jgi:hypothetical protein
MNAGGSRPNSGWILVVVLLSLCILGTWMTFRNYRSMVFTSTRASVVETSTNATVLVNQWPESRIRAGFPPDQAARIRPGMMARITVGQDPALLDGNVLSVDPATGIVTVALRGEAGETGRVPMASSPSSSGGKPRHYLPAGAPCAVTIDGTVPPEALASPSPRPR